MTDIRPNNHEIDLITDSIRRSTNTPNGGSNLITPIFSVTPPPSKMRFEEYSQDRQSEAYDTLSDGSQVAKFENYLPGTDNNERFAQQQTAGEKWANGVEKALLKTGNAVLGGTAGIVYGIGAMAAEGSLSALYDNDFSNTLADWDTKLGYQLPNYYTKQEQEKGLGGQMGTANFWADKVLGGLSFTAGAIISEGLWAAATGGTSLAVGAARWGARLGRGAADVAKAERWTVEALGEAGALTALAKNKGYLKQAIGTAFEAGRINIKTATNLGLAADVFNTARFAVTSAGFESSVEALQYKKEATANFYSTFFDKNGREPDANDIATFNENLTNSANAVFGVNMAIVGSSNLVTMGKLFELKNPIKTGFTEFIEAKAFGYGIKKTGAGTYVALEATRAQKIGRNIFAYSKAPITEGLYEEGLQGVTTKTANKWIDHTYSDKNTQQTFSTMGAVYESLSEQYGTKEGWVENGVGMIIGFLGGSVNTRSEQKAKQAQLEFKAQGLETFSPEKGLLQQALLPKKVMMANQITGFSAEAKAEAEQGNVVKSEIAGEGVIHAYLNHKYALGESFDEATNEIKTTLETITEEQFKNAEIENPTAWKEQKLKEFSEKAKAFKKNRKFSEYIIGKNPSKGEQEITSILGDTFKGMNRNEALIQSMTWILTEGETAGKSMNDIRAKISTEIGVEHDTTLDTISSLNRLKGYKTLEVESIKNTYRGLTEARDKVQREIAELNAAPKETEGDKVRGKDLEAKNLRLLDLNDNIAELNAKLTNIADELNKQKSYQEDVNGLNFKQDISGTTITAQTLLDLNDNVDKFKNLVESLKASNPQRGAYISDLLDEYSQAEDIFLANQRTMDMLTSGKMKLEKINTYLGKKMFKNKSMDEASREWLTDALNRYEKNVLSTVGSITNEEATPKTEEELIARKEELEKEEDRTEETDKELADINEQLKEPVIQNREVKPKSQLQEQIDALEVERAQKLAEVKPVEAKPMVVVDLEQQKAQELSEVKPIIVRERVETPSTIETVKDTKEEERLLAKKQKIEDSISKLEDDSTSEDRTKVVVYYADVAKGVEFNLIDGVWKTTPASTKKGQKVKPIEAGAKDLQKIEEALKENPNIAKIEKLKEQLAEVEQQLENIPLVEREVKQEPTFTETEVENTAEINRINAKYEKLMKSTPTPVKAEEDNNTKIDEELNKIQKEYDKKISDLEQEKADLLKELANKKKEETPSQTIPEKVSPLSEKEETQTEAVVTPLEAITENLTKEEVDILEQVAEENKSEGQTTEDFIKEEINKELNGEESDLKGSNTLINKFKALIRKLAKIFAIGAIVWTTANPMADFLGRNDIITREKTQFVIDIVNAPSAISENSLSEPQIAVLKQAIENAKSKGQSYVTYKEYPNQFAGVARVNPQTDTLGESIANVGDETVVKRLIGQFSFIEENGNYIITDKYNFNDAGQKSLSEGIQFIKEGFQSDNSTYSNIRRIGTVFGSIEGEGADVKVTVPVKSDEKTTDTPQKASLMGLGLLALLRAKNKGGEALSEEDLSNGKNRIAEIEAEIVKLKNELATKKQALNNSRTYSKKAPKQNAPQEDTTQQQKDKINREYDQRIQKLRTPPVDNSKAVEDYKNRIERMLAKGYYSLESIGKNYEDLKDLEPTQEEIEEFRKGKVELEEKLSNWKLLSSATDAEGNSIADLVKLIKQLETPQKETDTKTELTEEDIDFLQEGSEASGDIVVNELLQNFLAHAKVKKLKTGKYRFTHLKLSQIINRLITEDVKPTVKGEVVTLAEIDKLKPGAVVTILNTEFTLGESGRIEIDVKKFGSIKQALGFELLDSGGNWSYHDIYEYKGGTWTKVQTQYEDGTFEQSTSYELQKDDVVTFEIGNENGHNLTLYNAWINAQKALDESKATNKTKLEDAVKEALKEFKNGIVIYAVDSKGRRIAPLKALKSGIAEETFLRIRQRAFDNFDIALDKIDLKVTSKVVNVYLGTPQLLIFDGKAENTPFTKQTITQVEATGYIKDEEIVTSQEYPNGVDTTFLKKMVKQNKGVGIAFVVITKGLHKLAYPVNLKKGGETKLAELENLTANKEERDQILIINDLIQKYNLKVEKLVFGELQDKSRVEEVKSAFENYETHISLEKFANNKYNKEDLIKDATINIDLTDMDNAISDPKVRISLDEDVVKFEESKEVLKERERDLSWQMSDFVDKLYDKIYVSRGVELKDVEKNRFIDIMIDGTNKSIPLRATKGESQENADNYKRVNKNVLIEAAMYVKDLDSKGREFVGAKNIQEVLKLTKAYKRVLSDLNDLAENKNSSKKNSKCPK